MTRYTPDSGRLRLPNRLRARRPGQDRFDYEAGLADRLASLPNSGTTVCSVGNDGITVFGLGPTDRWQVLSRGWGSLHRQAVRLYAPRDEQELEVCWTIVRHAAGSSEPVQEAAPGRTARLAARVTAWPGELPRFSRTTLQ